MTYVDPPTDSADAAERRELEEAEARDSSRAHACVDGWTGYDEEERPIPCTVCRPHLVDVACRTCSATRGACDMRREQRRGRCCDHCDHRPARPSTGADR